jgi:hypothetical protein
MSSPTIERTILRAGDVRLTSADGQFVFSRKAPGVLLIEASGHDAGQFGAGALNEITSALLRERPLEVFVDARAVLAVAPSVREEWSGYLAANRHQLRAVHVLTRSRIVHLTVAVAQLLSNTGDLVRLYSSEDVFQRRLQRACDRVVSLAPPQSASS